ncbi:MAG: hypothetical protein A2W22_05755 [Candidatus Levybacteria bacterium RBG_16_35_11]|nr:MAG: hypothetical protein A2W22_05755 [Candidatus Levybacteria bacterium RBG_16_35_11]
MTERRTLEASQSLTDAAVKATKLYSLIGAKVLNPYFERLEKDGKYEVRTDYQAMDQGRITFILSTKGRFGLIHFETQGEEPRFVFETMAATGNKTIKGSYGDIYYGRASRMDELLKMMRISEKGFLQPPEFASTPSSKKFTLSLSGRFFRPRGQKFSLRFLKRQSL